jgi:bifunctional non-homologous end joining protein LigD
VASSDDALREYKRKRDPRVTNEPFAGPSADFEVAGTKHGDFVVHLHDATRRHYDLRLQVGSILKSFAVPRGPSLDPADKRLAVQTEDHPFEYLDFEDVIPEGSYGAGPMIVWDLGRIRWLENPPEVGLPKGKLDFELFGHKLRGRFALVETTARVKATPKQRQWLLLKKQDAHCREGGEKWVLEHSRSVLSGLNVEDLAQREQLERQLVRMAEAYGAEVRAAADFTRVVPMLCAQQGARLDDPERLYELKLDGVRILAERGEGQVRLKYRKPNALTQSYPDIERALATLFAHDFVIDGEIVAFDEAGKPSFQRLAPRISAKRPADIRQAVASVPVAYLVFDLLRIGPFDLTRLPLHQRKALLADLVRGKGLVRLLDHIAALGQPLFELAEQQHLEGVVSKLRSSTYQFGPGRTGDWVKHKCRREAEFVVVGWLEGKGSRTLGALELASYRGDELVYRGRVGGGIDDATLVDLERRLRQQPQVVTDVSGAPEATRVRHWVAPELVIRVEYMEWTLDRHLRMPSFKALVADCSPRACTAAPPEEWLEQRAVSSEPLGASGAAPAPADAASATPTSRVRLTNQSKVFWPAEGYTKGDLLAYYAAVGETLLPHLRGRPVMLVRYPDGIAGKSFYQWNTPSGTPEWMRTLQLRHEERDGKDVVTFLVDDVDSLLHIANLGCIPIHVLARREDSLESCDFLTIDFDLGEQPFKDAVILALGLKELLDEVGLAGYPKTSGQSGLHVLIPIGPGVPFAVAKVLVELLGRLLQMRFTDSSTMERRVRERGGRVYIDTGQTGLSRTIVAPYSVRAHPGARVSTPLLWDEVHLALKPSAFTMFTVPQRLAAKGDPMAAMLDARPNILQAVERLERWVRT